MFAAHVCRKVPSASSRKAAKNVAIFITRPKNVALQRQQTRHFQPSSELPFKQRFKLLLAPTAFTMSFGIGTYFLAEKFKSQRYKKYKKQQLPDYNILTAIIGANVLVFVTWRFTTSLAVSSFLKKFMLSNVYGPARTLSMLGSMFSHYSITHLFINMYVLTTVASVPMDPYKFIHLYVTGGLTAALGSYVRAVFLPKFTSSSLGASGALLSIIGYIFTQYPESRWSIALVNEIYPHSFSSQTALRILILFDTAGLLFGWRLFDHAAHLSGLCFGWLKGQVELNQ